MKRGKKPAPVREKQLQALTIMKELAAGSTLQEIGDRDNITREAIRQRVLQSDLPNARPMFKKSLQAGSLARQAVRRESQKKRCLMCNEVFWRYSRKTVICSYACNGRNLALKAKKYTLSVLLKARELRMQGLRWLEIAKELGFNQTEGPQLTMLVGRFEKRYIQKEHWIVKEIRPKGYRDLVV